jgi:hypothetical protein
MTRSNLAMVLRDLGMIEEAGHLQREAYETFKGTLGPEHRYTELARHNLDTIARPTAQVHQESRR